jgi:hypothetical protein
VSSADAFEREADRVADAVTHDRAALAGLRTSGAAVQRQEAPEKPRDQPTKLPVDDPPKVGQAKDDEEKEKLVAAGKKVAGELAKALLDLFSKSDEGKHILTVNEHDWSAISRFFEDFAKTIVGKIVLGTAAVGAIAGMDAGALAARDAPSQDPDVSPSTGGPVRRAPKDEQLFALELNWDFVTPPTGFTLKTPWIDTPKIGKSTPSATTPPPGPPPPMLTARPMIPRICTPADPRGDRGEADARSAWIYAWLQHRERLDQARVREMLERQKSAGPRPPLYGPSVLKPMFKRAIGAEETEDLAAVSAGLHSASRPLDAATRSWMEPRFGHDFSGVRVHTGAEAAKSARAVNALAYTVGQDVVFGAEQYEPHTRHGRHLIAHELTHVVQQSHATDRGTPTPSLQRQEAPGPPKKLTVEEYKKLDPSLQVMAWGPDFIQGFKKSGAASQVSDTARVVIEKGFTQSMDHPLQFRTGVMAGLPLGIGSAILSAVTSLAELGWELAKLWIRLHVTPAAVAKEVVDVVKNNGLLLLAAAEPLGEGVGKQVAKEATKFGIEFVNSTPLAQGLTLGKIIGRIIGEIALLFVGVGEVSAAAKFAANTRYGRMLLEAMEASRLLKPLVESTEAAKVARAAKAAQAEAPAAKGAVKAAEEARPEVAAAEDAAKTRPKPAQSGERPPVSAVKEPLPPSATKETLTLDEAVAEANFIDAHPGTIVSESPPRAKIGDHEVVQLPEGVCERHSKKVNIPCPKAFGKKSGAPPPKPSMLTKEPGKQMTDFELGRNMTDADSAYQIKAGGVAGEGYYVNGVQFDAFDRNALVLVEAKNWAADGRIVRALEAQEFWAGWKVVDQAQAQIKAARGFPIEWRVASPEAKKAIESIFKSEWKFPIKVVVR